jgi:hypothetical protein
MLNSILAGPSGRADWQDRQGGDRAPTHPTLLLLPDERNPELVKTGQPEQYYYLPKTPSLVRDGAGKPVFSLTLLLSRQPRPEDDTIQPLIQQGVLAFELGLTVAAAAIDALKCSHAADYQPLFVREAVFQLTTQDTPPVVFTSASGSGNNARAALSVTLDRPHTLDVLAALDGNPGALRVQGHISYRVATADQTVRLVGSWAAIHDSLRSSNPSGQFSRTELGAAFDRLLQTNLITVFRVGAGGREERVQNPDAAALFGSFLRASSVILRRETLELDPEAADNRYSLRPRPHDSFSLDYRQTLTGAGLKTIDLTAPLEQVLGGALEGLSRSQYIHLVAPTSGGGTVAAPPRRFKISRSNSRFARDGNGAAPMQLAAMDGSVRSLALAMQPDTQSTIAAHALLHSDLVQAKTSVAGGKYWQVDDARLELAPAKVASLPVVDESAGVVWRDRTTPNLYWYAPVFELVQPNASSDPQSSPFLFTYERTGATPTRPALSGTVRFRLQQKMGAAIQSDWQAAGKPAIRPVPIRNLSIALQLPFRDEKDGNLKVHSLQAIVTQTGNSVDATINLSNDWVRLCYGALAYPNFQPQPARLSVSYAYHAYVPLYAEEAILTYGGKAAYTPVLYSTMREEVATKPYFDAAAATYHFPAGEVRLKQEALRLTAAVRSPVEAESRSLALSGAVAVANRPAVVGAIARPTVQSQIEVGAIAAARPVVDAPVKLPPVVARPPLEQTIDLPQVIARTRYAVQTLVSQEQVPLLYPCRSLGNLYQEKIGGGTTAIGCRDTFQLGQTLYQQYEEIPELAQALYRVYRSLPQPGRFLVLPACYRITRYAPGMIRAYKPDILVYSTLDLANPLNNSVTFQAALQPDIPFYARRELLSRLSSYASNPTLVYPTEIECELEYVWTVDSRIRATINAVRTPDSFQIGISTDPVSTPLLKTILEISGIFGNVRFKLPDGSTLQSSLAMELTNITGPWIPGAIEPTLTDGSVRLVNRIEQEVAVSDLVIYQGTGVRQRLPVEAQLPAAGSRSVPVPAGVTEAYPVYSVPTGTAAALEEIRRFAEDIEANVIFAVVVNYANYGLKGLEIRARIRGIPGEYPVPLSGNPPVGELKLLLPLTTYLSSPMLQFQVTKQFESSQSTTAWIDWDLSRNGYLISLDWQMLQQI